MKGRRPLHPVLERSRGDSLYVVTMWKDLVGIVNTRTPVEKPLSPPFH